MSRTFCVLAVLAVLAASALAATEGETLTDLKAQLKRNQILQMDFANVVGSSLGGDLNAAWTIFSILVMIAVYCGQALIETASAEESETENTLTKYIATFGVVSLAWWATGHGLAYGANISENRNGFIGTDNILLSSSGTGYGSIGYAMWVFQVILACISTSIVTATVSGRVSLWGYVVTALVYAAFVYPVNIHWVWSVSGWLSAKNQALEKLDQGVLDHSGGAPVFLLAGSAALAALIVLGKRRNPPAQNQKDQVMILFGTLLFWVGFYGLATDWNAPMATTAKSVWSLTLAAATGGLAAGLTGILIYKHFNMRLAMNGILAGLVSLAAGNNVIEVFGGCTIALAGGIFYAIVQHVVNAVLDLDDSLDAVSIYLVNGFWGVVAASLWATKKGVEAAYPQFSKDDKVTRYGLFYGGGAQALGVALLTNLVTFLWGFALMFVTFKLLDYFQLLRAENHVTDLAEESEPTKESE
jgi:ammonium transporter, Amt family